MIQGLCTKCGEEVERSRQQHLVNAVCFICKRERRNKYSKIRSKIPEVRKQAIFLRKKHIQRIKDENIMKRSGIKRMGKVGEINREARKRIAVIAEEKELNYCEVGLEGCLGNMYLAPAHKNKRAWYKADVELLSDYNQWLSCCQICHNLIEHDRDLTEQLFLKLRGI